MSQPISVTLTHIYPDEDLIRLIRRCCEIIGDALADTWEWIVTLTALPGGNRIRANVHFRCAAGTAAAIAVGTDPYTALQLGLVALLKKTSRSRQLH